MKIKSETIAENFYPPYSSACKRWKAKASKTYGVTQWLAEGDIDEWISMCLRKNKKKDHRDE